MTLTTAERLTRLEHLVAQLRAEMGPEPNFDRDGYLDNPVHQRMHEIGLEIDRCVKEVDQFKARLNSLPSVPQAPAAQIPAGMDEVVAAFRQFGIHIGERAHSPIFIKSIHGTSLYFQSDTDNTTDQREGGKYPQLFGVALSGDGGGGLFQNIVYPEDGTPAYIPDPTRLGLTWRIDRMGAMSVDYMEAGEEFAPGKFRVVSKPGQAFVFVPDVNGNMTFRMPRYGSELFVEEGYGGHPDHPEGHREFRRRRRVVLEGDYPQS